MVIRLTTSLAWLGPWWRDGRSVAGVVVASAIGVALATFTGANIAFPVHVISNSMAPYVVAGDYGVAVYTHDIGRGDVIAFRFPFGSPTMAIKRVALLAGECMPPHGSGGAPTRPAAAWDGHCAVVPPGSVLILGDNIEGSLDSRHFGVVPANEIVGKVVLAIPVTRWLARWHAATGASPDAKSRTTERVRPV